MSHKNLFNKSTSSFILSLCFIVFLNMFSNLAVAENKAINWELKKSENGIQVFLRNTKNSAVKSFKGVMTVDGRLSSIVAVLEDIDSYPRWLFSCKSAKTLQQRSDTAVVNYFVTDMPWPVADRDSIVGASRSQNKSSKLIEIKLLAEPKLIPEVAGKVRIETMQGRWLLRPAGPGKINVIYEMTVDPGGNVPKWIVNAMSVDLPFNTLSGIREVMKEDKYLDAKFKDIID